MNHQETDIVVIGAGPAGAVASSWLNKQKYKVVVLEKTVFPRFVIGESLLPHCMDQLEEAGFLEAIKKHGFQVKTGAAFYKGNSRTDFLFNDQHTNGWSWTWQVKRADFDNILIRTAEEHGVIVKFGCDVISAECSADRQTIEYKDPEGNINRMTSRFVIDASGYGRVLPRLFDLEVPVETPSRSAVFCHMTDSHRTTIEGQNIFIHSFNNNKAWIWVIPFSDNTTSVGIVGETDFVTAFAAHSGETFISHIRNFEHLNGRFKDEELCFAPRSVHGYAVRSRQLFGQGYVLCGNSTEFLDPIFSSGVTLATSSGLMAAKFVHREIGGENVDWQNEYENVLKKGIDVFRTFVLGWYNGDLQTILFSRNMESTFKRQICSVLAGYVWDNSNPIVKKHKTAIRSLAEVIRLQES